MSEKFPIRNSTQSKVILNILAYFPTFKVDAFVQARFYKDLEELIKSAEDKDRIALSDIKAKLQMTLNFGKDASAALVWVK